MSAKRNSEHRLSVTNSATTSSGQTSTVAADALDEEGALERRLYESEERFRIMFEQANVGIAFASLSGEIQQVNSRYCEIVGYSHTELLGRNFGEITHPDDRALNWTLLEGLLHEATPMSVMEKRYVRRDGSIIWASLTLSLMRDAQGEPVNYMAVIQDITSRKTAEAERDRLLALKQEALNGLLAMAESLVQVSEDTEGLGLLGKHLAELTRHMLDCARVGIQTIEAETQFIRPLAVVGLSAEQERAWWEEQQQQEQSLRNSPTPELVARLRAGEVLLIDMAQPPFNKAPNPYNITVMLVAPMCVGNQLVGLLTLDYSGEKHHYSEGDLALASAVAKLSALVLERQRLLRERAEAGARELALHETNSRMEEFLGVVSHELRTPLTTIKANVQLALRRIRPLTQKAEQLPTDVTTKTAAVDAMLVHAERQINVLNRLIGDLIDISRIQAGKLQLQLRQGLCDLKEIVVETVQEQRKATPNRTLIFQTANMQSTPVIADPARIMQVLTNYLTNAIKYSEADKPVTISLKIQKESEQSVACVAVRDQGPGLSPEEQQRVWECFYQVKGIQVVSGSGVGLGLGLYISQMIIQRHQGEVGVESKRPGGSTFWFTLPLAQ